MIHLIKIPLQYADLFIHSLDLEKNTIGVETREKESGKLLTPRRVEKFQVMNNGRIYFAGSELPVNVLESIHQILN